MLAYNFLRVRIGMYSLPLHKTLTFGSKDANGCVNAAKYECQESPSWNWYWEQDCLILARFGTDVSVA